VLTSFHVGRFKSYGATQTLPLAALTVLIGANASGKSNAIEALQLLSWMAHGRLLSDLPHALQKGDIGLRGRISDLQRRAGENISLGCVLHASDAELSILLGVEPRGPRIVFENMMKSDATEYYRVDGVPSEFSNEIRVAYNSFTRGPRPHVDCIDQQAIFTQLMSPARFGATHPQSQMRIPAVNSAVQQALTSILFLDPHPAEMRAYSYVDEQVLLGDGSNISSVLKHVCETLGRKSQVLEFVRALPEQDIADIAFIPTPRNEVMLSLVETFGGKATPRDASVLSDGTLRVLAIAAAVLSVPSDTVVVIEEVDNGVHPSRARALMSLLTRNAQERNIQIILTTHNPALLDAVPDAALGDTVACYRDVQTGESRLQRLFDLEDFASLAAQGPLGGLAESGVLDRYLKHRKTDEQRAREGAAALAVLRRVP
jgi:predicted ATPase